VDNPENPEGAPSFSHVVRRACPERSRRGGDIDSQSQRHPPKTATHALSPKRRGEIAEAAFLHKAASLGFSVSKPWGESDRYDFIVDCGGRCWRVQIKSAHTRAKTGHGYTFHACGNLPGQPYTPRDIDFFVAYVVPEDVWYVLPIEVFTTIRSVKVFPASTRLRSRFEKYRNAWDYFRVPMASAAAK
jgi:hypothetical protein